MFRKLYFIMTEKNKTNRALLKLMARHLWGTVICIKGMLLLHPVSFLVPLPLIWLAALSYPLYLSACQEPFLLSLNHLLEWFVCFSLQRFWIHHVKAASSCSVLAFVLFLKTTASTLVERFDAGEWHCLIQIVNWSFIFYLQLEWKIAILESVQINS